MGEYLKEKGLRELVSHTTRFPRSGEVDGIAYHFVDKTTFDRIEKVEESVYAGNHYGVSKEEVEEKARLGDVFAVTEIHGALAFQRIYRNDVRILYIASSPGVLRKRMKQRGDSKESIRRRLSTFLQSGEAFQYVYAHEVLWNRTSKRRLFSQVEHSLQAAKGKRRDQKKLFYHPFKPKLFS